MLYKSIFHCNIECIDVKIKYYQGKGIVEKRILE